MAQFGRPISDIATTQTWFNEAASTTNIYLSIDEVSASDTDYIYSSNNGTGYYECGLTSSLSDPEVSGSHIMRWRLRRTIGNRALTLVTYLFQGTTLIASASSVDPSTAFTTGSLLLSGAQADSITNYADLRFRFDVTVNGGAGQEVEISWAELEIPNAAGGGGSTIDGQATLYGFEQNNPQSLNSVIANFASYGNADTIYLAENIIDVVALLSGLSDFNLNSIFAQIASIVLGGSGDISEVIANLNIPSDIAFDGTLSSEFIASTLTQILVSWVEFIIPQIQSGLVSGAISMSGNSSIILASLVSILSSVITDGNSDNLITALLSIQSLIQIFNSSDIVSYPIVNIVSNASIDAIGDLLLSGFMQKISSIDLNGQANLIGLALQISDGEVNFSGYGNMLPVARNIINARLDIGGILNLIATGTTQEFIQAQVLLSGLGDFTSQTESTIFGLLELGTFGHLILSSLVQEFASVDLDGSIDIDSNSFSNLFGFANIYGLATLIASPLFEGIINGEILLSGIGNLNINNLLLTINSNAQFISQLSLLTQSSVGIYAQAIIDGDEDTQLNALNLISTISQIIGQLNSEIFGRNYEISSVSIQNELLLVANAVVYANAVVEFGGMLDSSLNSIIIIPSFTQLSGNVILEASGISGGIQTAYVSFDARASLLSTTLNLINGQTIFSGSEAQELQALVSIVAEGIMSGELDNQFAGYVLMNAVTALYGAGILVPVGDIVTSIDSSVPLSRAMIITSDDRMYLIDKDGRIFLINSEDRTYKIGKYN